MGGSGASAQIAVIRAQAAQLLGTHAARATGQSNPGGHLLLNAGIRELVPWGWQGTSRKVLAAWGRSAKIAARNEANRRVDALVGEARAMASSHSVADGSLLGVPEFRKAAPSIRVSVGSWRPGHSNPRPNSRPRRGLVHAARPQPGGSPTLRTPSVRSNERSDCA